MKYTDKNTIKTVNKLQNRNEDLADSFERKRKKELKKSLLKFSYKIKDKFWWNSLSEEQKISVYNQYISDFHALNHVINMSALHSPGKSNEVRAEWFDKEMIKLANLYRGDPHKKRDLIINDILK